METNDLGFVASLMFVLVPTVFLIVLFIQTNSREGSSRSTAGTGLLRFNSFLVRGPEEPEQARGLGCSR